MPPARTARIAAALAVAALSAWLAYLIGTNNPPFARTPSRRTRVAAAAAVAIMAAVYTYARVWNYPPFLSDLDPQLCAARVWWTGGDAYQATGPGRVCDWGWPLYHPATTFVVLAPIAWFPPLIARALFCALSAFALTLALTRDGWHRLPLLASAAMQSALARAQWEPLVITAVVYPVMGALWAAKPNAGEVGAVGALRWWGIASSIVVVTLSLVIDPHWPAHWFRALHGTPHVVAMIVAGPIGWIGLLAFRRWRDPSARMTAAFTLTPLTHQPYASVLLFLAPRTWAQACALAIATNAGFFVMVLGPRYDSFAALTTHYARWAAPLAAGVAVWCAWGREDRARKPSPLLLGFTLITSALVLWASFAIASGLR